MVAHKDAALKHYAPEVAKLEGNPALGGSLGSIDVGATVFEWGPQDMVFFADIVNLSKEIIFTSRSMFMDLGRTGWVFRGLGCFLRLYQGKVGVLLLPKETIVKHTDLNAYIRHADGGFLLKTHQITILEEGDSLWLPVGSCPALVGLPKDKDFTEVIPKLASRGRRASKLEEHPPYCMGISLCLRQSGAAISGDTRRATAAIYNLHIPMMPKCIKTDKGGAGMGGEDGARLPGRRS